MRTRTGSGPSAGMSSRSTRTWVTPVAAPDVPDPRRARVDEIAEPAADHVAGRELGYRGDHRVRAEGDRRTGRRPDVHGVPDGRALGHAAHDRLRVPVAAAGQREPVGRHGERAGPGHRRVVNGA